MEEHQSSPSTSASAEASSSSSSSSPASAVSEERQSILSSSSSSGVDDDQEQQAEDDENEWPPVVQLVRQQTSVTYRPNLSPPRGLRESDGSTNEMLSFYKDQTWSCIVVVLTFWLLVSMTLILAIYGSDTVQLGPYSSIVLQTNPLFLQYIKAESLGRSKVSPVLYGLTKSPHLSVTKTWAQLVNASIRADSHKEWLYLLNKGSQMNISYNVAGSSSLLLIIAQGLEDMDEWLEDPSYPNTTLSWNVVHGKGMICQDIYESSEYYVAMGNLNLEDVQVQLSLQVRSLMYDTTDAYYKCKLAHKRCNMKMLFPSGNTAILTSPGPRQEAQDETSFVEVSYEPRWITYILGIGGMTLLMLLAFSFLNKLQCINVDRTEVQAGVLEPERAPLLLPKDDDLLSCGSSFDSISSDDEELKDHLEKGLLEGKSVGDAESGNITRQLCVVCFDAPKDCFFLPCGHCATCFPCGTRIAEAAGSCPICRRKMKKVRKIFTV